MVTSNVGSAPTERPQGEQKKTAAANCGPMMQQGTLGAHGHEMHPQEFIRLVGCHEQSRRRQDALQHLS